MELNLYNKADGQLGFTILQYCVLNGPNCTRNVLIKSHVIELSLTRTAKAECGLLNL